MTKHSKSLFLSLLIHSMLLAVIFYAYSEVSSYIGHKKEKKVCIKLGCIESVAAQAKERPKKELKKVQKRVKKTPPPKKVQKKERPKKKSVPKKVIPVKKIEKLPEPKSQKSTKVEEKEALKEDVTIKQNECPAQQIKPQEVAKVEDAQEKNTQKESSSQRYMNRHLAEIAQLLQENLYYPRRARKRGIEGRVLVKFVLQTDAKVQEIEILSSEDEILSRGAIRTLEDLSGAFPKPDEKMTLTVPISYSLQR
jgi:protein TonB